MNTTAQPNALEELLRKKKIAKESEPTEEDWQKEKALWLTDLQRLFNMIAVWLAPMEKEGLLKYHQRDIEIYEEDLGTYKAPQIRIEAFGDYVDLVPVGTVLIGGYGRVDLVSRNGERAILALQKRGGQWAFLERTPRVQYYPLTEENFEDILSRLLK
jgi:hypothetical protein